MGCAGGLGYLSGAGGDQQSSRGGDDQGLSKGGVLKYIGSGPDDIRC